MLIFDTNSLIKPAKEGADVIGRSILFRVVRDTFTAIGLVILIVLIVGLLGYLLFTINK